jgi:hypothetical protein
MLHGGSRSIATMTTVAAARREWEDGNRRFAVAARDPAHADILHRQRDAVLDELRRRVGAVFTLTELAAAYGGAERWLQVVVDERAPARGGVRTVSVAGDAAFHAYSRGAQDYEP